MDRSYEKQLLEAIPVTKALGLEVEEVSSDSVKISAPLSININYEGTAFGGSLNTVAILSGYLLVHHTVRSLGCKGFSLVIQSSQINYHRPVKEDFVAEAQFEDSAGRDRSLKLLKSKGRGRFKVKSKIYMANNPKECVEFSAQYVVKV